MDGVERVMVLGILAVIVAILSFAWSATDESAAPVGALGRDVVSGSAAISLSSSASAGDSVVLDEAARHQIAERMRVNQAAREARLQKSRQLMNEDQPLAKFAAAGKTLPGATSETQEVTPARELSEQIPLKPSGSKGEPDFLLYELVSGDTLWDIAYRSVGAGDTKRMLEHIQRLNPGLDSSSLSVGRTIKLPKVVPAQLQNMTPAERAEDTGGRVYIVGEGDTLGAIAQLELDDGSRWKEIYQLNKTTISDPERIRPGQRLILPDE